MIANVKKVGEQTGEDQPRGGSEQARPQTHHLPDRHRKISNTTTSPGELLTGEGDPGLTLTGGSGHA